MKTIKTYTLDVLTVGHFIFCIMNWHETVLPLINLHLDFPDKEKSFYSPCTVELQVKADVPERMYANIIKAADWALVAAKDRYKT